MAVSIDSPLTFASRLVLATYHLHAWEAPYAM